MTADPATPQPGDRWRDTDGRIITIRSILTTDIHGESVDWWTVTLDTVGDAYPRIARSDHITDSESWSPVLPPLITEPVTLHHRVMPRGGWALDLNDDSPWITLTGRKIELRPDGTWSEVTS